MTSSAGEGMLPRLGEFVAGHRKAVLAMSLIMFIVSGVAGAGVISHLSSGGFEDPAAESSRAKALLADVFDARDPNLVLLVTARDGSVDDPVVADAGTALTMELMGQQHVTQAFSYWTLGSPPPLRSNDGRRALVLARISGSDNEIVERVEELTPRYTKTDGPITIGFGGAAEIFRQISAQIEEDIARAELLSLPITLLLLVVAFGSVIAASLPLAVGVLAIAGTLLVLRILAAFTEVSVYALNLTTALGLGLAIDYSLFVVSRFREELHMGLEPRQALVRTVDTAGRTVLFSAATVAISLAALVVFPLSFLRSFAYAGIAVVALAAVGSVVFLPAMLAVLGGGVNRWALWHRPARQEDAGFWHREATWVMRRPVPIAVVVVLFLLLLGAPFTRIAFGLPDDRVLPTSASSRQVQDEIRTSFTSQEADALSVVAVDIGDPTALQTPSDAYASALSRSPGAARVDAATGSYVSGQLVAPPNVASSRFVAPDATWFSVVPSVEPHSAEGEALVKAVRAVPSPFPVVVGGTSAQLVDSKKSLFDSVPLAGALIALVTFIALFLMTGGVLVPVKAVFVNLLSLTATFGAMVWIFQEGHLSGVLDFTATGTIVTTIPILMFCIAFGLSMDYEVFLLSRVKEEYDRTADNETSVALGLQRTGRIVTAAAVLLAAVFIAFATSKVSFIKLFGLGLALAVVMDATLVRAALVPAFMRLAGRANWWAPAPLRRFHARFGLSEARPRDRRDAAISSGAGKKSEGGDARQEEVAPAPEGDEAR